jgi:hypothetical protein
MESTGIKNRIHCSKETAELLRKQGKERWILEREDKVIAKGKGELTTFWINTKETHESKSGSVLGDDGVEHVDEDGATKAIKTEGFRLASKNERLAGWITDLLIILLKQLVSSRATTDISEEEMQAVARLEQAIGGDERTVLEETPSYVPLPKFDDEFVAQPIEDVSLDPIVIEQLKQYVLTVASMYKENPFHNFEHCAHVSMSVRK